MRIEGDLDNMQIIAPKMRPFSERERSTCPACGIRSSSRWRAFLRRIRGKRAEVVVDMHYCPGDKPPSETLERSFLLLGPTTVEHKCTGIPLPHLHIRCLHCKAEWFSETKERA